MDDVEGFLQLGHAEDLGNGKIECSAQRDADSQLHPIVVEGHHGEIDNRTHGQRCQQGGRHVLHLAEEAHVDEFAGIIGVDGQARQ